jgi:uncharacterized protein (TIGR03663 family)
LKSTITPQFKLFLGIFVIVLILAAALRLPHLAQRPLHTDEAVHAVKFGQLLEHNLYQYDPFEYHGPTLIYATLIPAWLCGQHSLAQLTETTLRIVPAVFGLLLVALTIFLSRYSSHSMTVFAALFTAVSPAFVFYSRYYIMEMLLVVFTFAFLFSLYQFQANRKIRWVLSTGVFMGLMHATKETCIITWAAALAALVLLFLEKRPHLKTSLCQLPLGKIALGLSLGLLVSALFFSSFGKNPHGIIDSFLTYKTYLHRGSGELKTHVYPWFTYFKWLTWNSTKGRPLWTEGFILLLGLFGSATALLKPSVLIRPHRFWRFITFYTIILTAMYAVIPYKTPWSMLSFYHGWILLAALGASALIRITGRRLRPVVAILLAVGTIHLGGQALALSKVYSTDVSNPYVYAHTHRDIFKLTDAVSQLCQSSASGNDEYIEVICPGDDYWPLPWYLRRYSRTGYFNRVNMDYSAARIIIAMPSVEDDLIHKLYELPPPGQKYLYIPFFENGLQLRDGVEIDLYVRKDLWDNWSRNTHG